MGCVLSEERDGLVVKKIVQGGAAHLSGRIAADDILLGIDGLAMRTLQTVAIHLASRPIGSLFTLLLKREGDLQIEKVALLSQAQRPVEDYKEPCGISAALNVVPEGVRVDQILSGGAAWLSGALLPGDIIVAIDGEQVGRYLGGCITA
jgi:C-terminal processing protease CtpA/Prc